MVSQRWEGRGFVFFNIVKKSLGFINIDAETPWGGDGQFYTNIKADPNSALTTLRVYVQVSLRS